MTDVNRDRVRKQFLGIATQLIDDKSIAQFFTSTTIKNGALYWPLGGNEFLFVVPKLSIIAYTTGTDQIPSADQEVAAPELQACSFAIAHFIKQSYQRIIKSYNNQGFFKDRVSILLMIRYWINKLFGVKTIEDVYPTDVEISIRETLRYYTETLSSVIEQLASFKEEGVYRYPLSDNRYLRYGVLLSEKPEFRILSWLDGVVCDNSPLSIRNACRQLVNEIISL